MELRLQLKPFIPDMIPSVADVDAMLKVAFCWQISLFFHDCFFHDCLAALFVWCMESTSIYFIMYSYTENNKHS